MKYVVQRSNLLLFVCSILVVYLVSCSGCATRLSIINPETIIEGNLVTKTTLYVNKAFSFRPALWYATYPVGTYIPQFEDKTGVYFKSVNQIIGQTVGGGRTVAGGLYVHKTSWSKYQAYVDEGGALYKFNIPFEIDVSVMQSQ